MRLRIRFGLAFLVGLVFAMSSLFSNKFIIDALSYEFEARFPGVGQSYSNYSATPSQFLLARVRGLHPSTEIFFRSSDKGPRLDQWTLDRMQPKFQQRNIAPLKRPIGPSRKKRKLAEVNFLYSLFGSFFTSQAGQGDIDTSGISQSVNRQAKSDMEVIRATVMAKKAPARDVINPEEKLRKQRDLAALFFAFGQSGFYADQAFRLTEVDRGYVRQAALPVSIPHYKSSKKFPTRNPRQLLAGRPSSLYYGELMSQKQRYKEKVCMATAIYFEARGEPVHGQLAVAQVIMNRVRETRYPNTICGVVYDGSHRRNRCQFSFACDGRSDIARNKKSWTLAKRLAVKTIDGKVWLNDISYASHYHASYVRPRWSRYMRRIKRVGVHIFYKG